MKKWQILAATGLILIPAAAFYWDGWGHQAAASDGVVGAPSSVSSPVARTSPLPPQAQGPKLDTVKPSPKPAPAADWNKASQLESAVDKAMAGFGGRYSVVVHDLKSGRQWTRNPGEPYHPASTIKLPVTLYALAQYRANKLGWQEMVTYTEADFESPGGGAFETAPFGGKYPVENLVGRALKYSNNVAVNMLGRHLGWENIRTWSRTIGGDLRRQPDGTPEVTAMSELGWWLHLEKLSREEPKAAAMILEPLGEVSYEGRIAGGLPKGVPYLHKFGSYDGYFHDGGWIKGEHPFMLIVMTHGGSEAEADAYIPRVAAAVYDVMAK